MHPLEKIAKKWSDEENKFFENHSESKDYYQLELKGNKRTGNQIEEWKSPTDQMMEEGVKNWDGKSELRFELPDDVGIGKFQDLLRGDNVPEVLPQIGQMILYKSSKVTDFINGSFLDQYGLIVSNKAKTILNNFNLGNHKYYPLAIVHKNEIYNNYWFLRSSASLKNYIDFEKSNFYKQKGLLDFSSREPITINSKKELKTYRSKVQDQDIHVKASELFLKNDFPKYDLFVSKEFGIQCTIISSKLKAGISELTGINVKTTKRIK